MFSQPTRTIFNQAITQVGVVPLQELLSAMLGGIARQLAVERVGYFRLEDEGQAIQLEIQYLLSTNHCSPQDLRLHAADFPGYFNALHEPANLIVSHDVLSDARLVEFKDAYFTPLGITSMLDAPVHRSGKLYGVVCLEHVGEARTWSTEDVELARNLGHFIALAIETHQRQLVEEELRQALEREKELVELKTNFVNLVSHEFRTPLGIIYSSADILESYFDRLKPAQRADHLHDIRHAARQMTTLMEEVLLLGKVESGNMNCRQETFDLVAFCKHLVDEHHSSTNRLNLISITFGDVTEPACGDEGLLRHILGNVLSNAIKYSPEGSPVRFSVQRKGTFAEFEIEDHGIGIEAEDHKHLFTAFHRGRNVGSSQGTGLGLVIVKRCVDLHGGTMEFESEPGKGTRFLIRLGLFPHSARKKSAKAARKPLRTTA